MKVKFYHDENDKIPDKYKLQWYSVPIQLSNNAEWVSIHKYKLNKRYLGWIGRWFGFGGVWTTIKGKLKRLEGGSK